MVPPDIMVCLGDETILHADFNAANKTAFKAQYDLGGVLAQFHFHGTVAELLDHIDAVGLDEKNVAWFEFEPQDEVINLLDRDDIDPRYLWVEEPDYFVVIEHEEIEHYFAYTVAEQQGRTLEDFLGELGLRMCQSPEETEVTTIIRRDGESVGKIVTLNLADWEDLDTEVSEDAVDEVEAFD